MTRRALSFLACAVLVAGVQLTAQSIDDIVSKNLQARGFADKLQAVQTMKQTAHVTFQGMTGTITVYGKRPNLVRQEIAVAGQTVVNAFDGTTAWSINPLSGSSEPTVVTGPQAEDIKMQSEFDSPLVNYKAKGYDVQMIGTETLNGREVYHLKLIGTNKRVQNLYIDAKTNLEAQIVGDSSMGQIANELSDYRDVNGVKMPFMMRTLSNGAVLGQIAVDTIEINPKIDDAIFKLPKK
jgi:outer membrane lipoprotein-sorting protein